MADFGASTPTSGCAPLVVAFTNSSSGATSYKWNLGNGVISTGTIPSTTYSTPGTYTVTLTAYNGTDSSVKTKTAYITVYDVPAVSFSGSPLKGCPGTCVNFSDASNLKAPGSGSYLWDFGDGTSDTNPSTRNCFSRSGYYNISLIVKNSRGCTSTLVKDSFVHIFPAPVAAFTASPLRFCSPTGHVTFTNASNSGTDPLRYTWRFGDGNISHTVSPTHDYTSFGNFDVTLVVTDTNGCKDSIDKPGFIIIGRPTASFTAPANGCTNSPVTFPNTTTSPGGSTWLYGDGSSTTGRDGYHSYSTAGTYTVRLVINDGTCTDTAKKTITISDGPVDSFSFSPKEPCPAPVTVNFTFKGSGASSYSWDFGDGGTSSSANQSHTYAANGVYYVTLTTTGPTGCVSVAEDSVFVRDFTATILEYPSNEGCAPLTINFSENIRTTIPFPALYPFSISSYKWEWGDGTPDGSGLFPTHTYTDSGIYAVRLTVTHNPGGCTATTVDTIKVGIPPFANFHTDKDTFCAGTDVIFHNTTTGRTDAFIWNFGDGSAPNFDINPDHVYEDTGTFKVRLVAKFHGCPDTVYHNIYILPSVPVISIVKPVNVCYGPGDSILFSDSLSILMTSHLWSFGDGDTSTLDKPWHVFERDSVYEIYLAGYNSTTGCHDTTRYVLSVVSARDSLWAMTDTAICLGGSVTMRDSLIGLRAVLHYWTDIWADTSMPIPRTGNDTVTETFKYPGLHTIVVSAGISPLCMWSAQLHVLVGDPSPGFKASTNTSCVSSTITFTDTSTDVPSLSISKRLWTFGNGDTLTTRSSTVNETYNKKGVDSVKLVVTDNLGCKDSLTKLRYVHIIKPIASFYASNTLPCNLEPVYFYNYSKADTTVDDTLKSYYWTFGDGDTSTMQSPNHSYKDTGGYTVRLIVRDKFGCSDTMTKVNFIILNTPHAAFTMDDSTAICPPLHVQFTNTSSGAVGSYWDMGDSNTYTITNPGHTFTSSRYYNVKLVVTNVNGCKDSVYEHVNIYGYDGALTYTPLSGCAPLTVNFKASILNAPVAVWDFNDGNTFSDSGVTTTTYTYNHPGAYLPKLILGDGKGCKSGSSGLDTIKVDGVIARYKAHQPCIGDTVVFRDSSFSYFSPVVEWHWALSGGLTSNTNYAVNRYFDTGRYPVTLIVVNGNGCKDTLTDSVKIYPLPTIDAGPDTSICTGDAATLMPSGGVGYIWQPDPTLSCTNCDNPKASPAAPTTYTVMGIDSNGCRNTDTVRVSLQTKTTSILDNGGDICQGDTAHLHASGAQIYTWSPADSLTNAHIADPLAFPMSTTTYTVIAKEGSCVPDTNTTVVTVHPKPVVNAGTDVTIVGGESTTLQANGSNIVSFLWDSTQTLSCLNCSNPVATPTVTTTYIVVGSSDYGCKDTDDVIVNVKCDKSQVFIPNAFTPNGDGQNDIFFPRGVSITNIKSFRVYNRWGEVVFEKTGININDEKSGWDGNYGGAQQPPAVYVYIIDAICESGEELILKGDVTIIR
ncbi:MAG: PKD domain-containing protein [Bacteroidetes bacterium]|nr:PKD domain-containing protein [Bacteroidota bacterium]